ncbi:hypothetical protein EOA27_00540 [Mesorhizobium sp. M2A.F.Ca.ET.037.01.1.1]|uniref:hypothetical protein n=1 Tax=unclassified Mesorhizobium TaxID=325217 RepID=UPI000FCADF2C|nr:MULTISPECIES: hypothetical protein [unclassified Mesorhizobium]RUY13116.1 hypothetical protein EOA25_01420 [Mesorhizobium sp. M2A.F.Ca.ET.040.01.1.1]RUX23393.1 hypothetical protein EOA27_00540 [Mesorhizobium sp. M2A.F.Ca.ET.037.01.1.1]RWA89220.1 MAG: hypothetical protein EOQ31_18530 [Mesorhizobium sp.]RWE85345.1 MAG: hypothetical protein EOS63_01535 [Mesorhizobium sp.]TIV20109.1 MAG: hypothetical protein E5V95_05585 [Mesorhizobium sp.]
MDKEQRQAIKEMLAKRSEANTQSKKQATKWLIDEGLLTTKGQLRAQYGGEDESEKTKRK